MRVLDLFCGAGGFGLGFKRAGFEVKGVDNWEPAVRVYRRNVGEAELRDVREIKGGRVVGVIGGPPCEPHTYARPDRKDPEERLYRDPVGSLVLEFVRIVRESQPEFYVMENVMGILDARRIIKREFREAGYKVKVNVLEAAYSGVPSFRKRVFFSNVRIRLKKEPWRTVWDAIGDLPEPDGFPDHVAKELPKKVRKRMWKLKWGQGAVYFRGARGILRNFIRLHPLKPAPTVMGKSRFIHPFRNRMLTPREHARLMSFPDTFVFGEAPGITYDLIGEAVPPLLAEKIAREIRRRLGI